jgi:serine/threonine protein kinase
MTPLPQDWSRALRLLDEALGLHPTQREPWLALTAAHEPGVMPLLNKLLEAHGRVETHALLATLPKVKRATPMADGGAAGMLIGPFKLIEPLGRGGMGSVWRARYADGRMKRDVAIKLPALTHDATSMATLRERFARERDFLAQLVHPHIARLYDAGVSDNGNTSGQPYLAMEFVAGQAIDDYADTQRLPIRARLDLFLQVLDAVGYAHQQLVLHRDLKAGNVLVDEQGQVRLLDFGVARLLPPIDAPATEKLTDDPSGELTERAGAAYTLGHAAPEQVNHGALSTATDVYALGVMLYRLLTGLSPYQPARDTRGALEEAVLLATPAAASSRTFDSDALQARQTTTTALRKTLRDNLDVILAKALKKSPQERYATVALLADDLRRHVAQQPISARADSGWYRSRLFVARNRVAVVATSLAAVALVGTAGVAVWQAQVSARNAALATNEALRANTVQKFIAELLAKADPQRNKNITAVDREVIDRALESAQTDFADSPETLALVLKQLGDIYDRLGLPAKHLEVQHKRVLLLRSVPSASADETVEAELSYGSALSDSKLAPERAQALRILVGARDMALRLHTSAPHIVRAHCLVADQLRYEGKHEEADASAMQAVAYAERNLPDPHPRLSYAYAQRAATAAHLSDFDTARVMHQKAMAVDATGQGRGQVDRLMSRATLARIEHLAGNYVLAKEAALSGLEFARLNLGQMEGTLTPFRTRAVLASVAAGQLDEAAELARRLLPTDLNSDDKFRVGRAHFAAGAVAMARGELVAAAQSFTAAEPGLASQVWWQRQLVLEQATLMLRSGQLEAAYSLFAPLVDRLRTEVGNSAEEFGFAAQRTAVILARRGDRQKAQRLMQEGCAWSTSKLKPSHPNHVRCAVYLLLLDGDTLPAERQRAIASQLKRLDAETSNPLALTASVRISLAWAGKAGPSSDLDVRFPLLD